jgi:probable HAF family extracellular repeat protein
MPSSLERVAAMCAGTERFLASLVVAVFAMGVAPAASAASFFGFGFCFSPSDVSADGEVVVGAGLVGAASCGTLPSYDAIRWTAGGGATPLPPVPGATRTGASAVSADGDVVVGRSDDRPFRWTPTTGTVALPIPPAATASRVLDVSGDGSVMVGTVTENGVAQAFRWTAGSGTGAGLGFLPGADYSEAYGVSPDGSVVVGQALNDAGQAEAFRWTSDDGMIGLGQLPGGDFSGADAVSADGSVVVGVASALFQEGFRWTAAGGMVGLGMAVGTVFLPDSLASDVSADGSVIVGSGHLDTSPPDTSPHALIWDPIHGWRLVEEVLVSDYGLDLTGWTLTAATAISGDGLTLVGLGTNPEGEGEGWIAHLASVPEPAASLLLLPGLLALAAARACA